jgi:hypothetical protein
MRYDLREQAGRDGADVGGLGRDRACSGERVEIVPHPLVPTEHLHLPNGPDKELVRTSVRTYRLRGPQTQMLAILGTFRVVDLADIRHYGAESRTLENDLRSLAQQGLMAKDWFSTMSGSRINILSLTARGKSLLDQAAGDDTRQVYRAGPADLYTVRHDIAIYRMYQQEAGRLEAAGARIVRVLSEEEIERQFSRHLKERLRGATDPQQARHAAKAAFAEDWQLPLLNDGLQIPDIRLEYDTAEGERDHRDLELVTERYSAMQVSTKVDAGFVVYRPAGGATRDGAPDGRQQLERLGA